MKVAAWNVRGLGSQQKKSMVKNFIKDECVDFISLVETKHAELSQWDLMAVWGQQSFEWVHVPATEGSGGLLVTWHTGSFGAISSIIAPRWVCVIGDFCRINSDVPYVQYMHLTLKVKNYNYGIS